MTYNPNDPNDPLRHKFLERKTYDGYVMPIDEKIANALGTTPDQLEQVRQVQSDGVHVERVPRKIRSLLRAMG